MNKFFETNPNAVCESNNWSVLMMASLEGNYDLVELLINKGANVNYICPLGWTALMIACINCHVKIIEFLIEKGANINAKTNDGFNPLMCAMINKNNETLISYLIEKGANLDHAEKWLKDNNQTSSI
jgi:ankyrin repeat protein